MSKSYTAIERCMEEREKLREALKHVRKQIEEAEDLTALQRIVLEPMPDLPDPMQKSW